MASRKRMDISVSNATSLGWTSASAAYQRYAVAMLPSPMQRL